MSKIFKLPHNQLFNAEAANVINLGMQRSLQYCQVNNINKHNKIARSEDDAPLSKLKISAEDRSVELKRAIVIGTSTDMKELSEFKPKFTKAEIGATTKKLVDLMKVHKVRKDNKRDDMLAGFNKEETISA
jgi:hypothetical protein